jgi:phospholipid/cholesterol/gamma-HCH transport system substrate-binding protein
MTRSRGRHYRVGMVVLAAAVLFCSLIAFTIGSSLHRQTLAYGIHFAENVKGMVVGSKVNFQGVPAGAVTGIRFADGHSVVAIEVGADQCVVQDVTRARLDRLLVTGQVTIELEGYEPGRARLGDGALIPPAVNPMDELTKSLPNVVDSVPAVLQEAGTLLGKLNAVLDDDNCRRLDRILVNLEVASSKLPRAIDGVAGPVERAALELTDVLKQADAALAELRTGVADARALLAGEPAKAAVAGLAESTARMSALQHEVTALVGDARSLLAGNRGAWTDALVGFRDAMRDVRGLARMLQLAPNAVLYGRQAQEPAARGGGQE